MTPALPCGWNVVRHKLLSDGIGGRVWRVELDDGRVAVLKQASTAALEDIEGASALLRWLDGDGAVRLIERRGDMMMLEWAGEDSLLDHLGHHGDDAATEIAAEVLTVLHREREEPFPAGLVTLEDNFAGLFAKAEKDRIDGERSQFVEAAETAQRLLANQRGVRPLHGDIHHENILHSRRGWLAIDPKGVIGDPAFDIANMFYNPVESELRASEARALSMATILSRRLRRDPAVLLDYGFAFSALSASWHMEDGNADEAARSLAVGRAVEAARDQFTS